MGKYTLRQKERVAEITNKKRNENASTLCFTLYISMNS